MSLPSGLDMASLSDRIADAIGHGTVTHALFTTFTFDPGFFELHGLPLLFPKLPFSHVDKPKRVQLEDALRDGPQVAVYYDRSGLVQEGSPPALGWHRVDIGRKSGIFHPKLVLVLVERASPDADANPVRSLIIGISSANITRNGWWENLEVAHFMELPETSQPNSRSAYRKDLLSILGRLKDAAPEGDESVRTAIHDFVRSNTKTHPYEHRTVDRKFLTRIYCGQQTFPKWLADFDLARRSYNLEVISPFFDGGDAKTLAALIEATEPRAVRVFLPFDPEGKAKVDEAAYNAIAELDRTVWGTLPDAMTARSGNAKAARLNPRTVHAKVYRFWSRDAGEVVVVGSVNLTRPAHSHGASGNLEVAVLVDRSYDHRPVWWLKSADDPPNTFTERGEETEHEGIRRVPIDVSVRFDWRTNTVDVRGVVGKEVEFTDTTGKSLFRHEFTASAEWEQPARAQGLQLRGSLVASAFILAKHEHKEWRVLVHELGCGFKPSQLSQLTAEEILQYWALLTPEQRQAFIDDKLRAEDGIEGLAVGSRSRRYLATNSLFERFSGIFHAFACLRRKVVAAIDAGRLEDAESRVFGSAYDSLPSLVDRIDADDSDDPTRDYVTLLCARQLLEHVRRHHGELWQHSQAVRGRLEHQLDKLTALRSSLGLDEAEAESFLAWFDKAFVDDISSPEAS